MIRNYTGVSGSRVAWLIAQGSEDKLFIVVSSGRAAERLAGDLSFCAPDSKIIVVPEDDDIQVLYEARDRSSQVTRIQALHYLNAGTINTGVINTDVGYADSAELSDTKSHIYESQNPGNQVGSIRDPWKNERTISFDNESISAADSNNGIGGRKTIIIVPVSAAARPTETPERYSAGLIHLAMGDVMEPADLRAVLGRIGYVSAAVTESPGEFTSRGGILDVFSPAYVHPVRIEFFGDEIDSIRYYDQDTQRSLENAPEITIGPAAEFIPTEDERAAALARIRREYDKRIRRVRAEHTSVPQVSDTNTVITDTMPDTVSDTGNVRHGSAANTDSAVEMDGHEFGNIDTGDTNSDNNNKSKLSNAIKDGRIEALEAHKGRVTDLFETGSNIQIYSDFIEYFDVDKARLWDHAASGGGKIVLVDPSRLEEALPESVKKEEWYRIYELGNRRIPASRSAASQTYPQNADGPESTSFGAIAGGTDAGSISSKADNSASVTGLKHSDSVLSVAATDNSTAVRNLSKSGRGNARPGTDIDIYTPYPEMIRGAERIDEIVNVRSRQTAPFNGQIDLFAEETGKLAGSGYAVTIVSSTEERGERIREYLEIADVEGNITYRTGSLSSGFIMDDLKACFITESDIYPDNHRRARKSRKRGKSSDSIQFSDLHKGDYIVHETHGIGRFEGIRPITADGQTRDYLVIRYAGSDVLYIPTEQLDIIQKYIGNSGNAPALSRLSGGSWKRTRDRARKAIMEIAEDLVKLYAERQAAGGYAFGPDTVWQAEFEDSFPYTETDDQLRATEEIKEDMERPLPMDRLLCGDVGYGKTEVAARAIFKCLSEGKQAALLAPTTLLVNQHYHTLKERFAQSPFRIDELSRFRTPQAQRQALKTLKSGETDLIIGTHRLLSDDVRFKDLGLLVIDEEQRFGVRHKEKIKQLRQNIDVLTLSATPIPRTLNMSLTGIKDISIIDEPPGDRIPVHTYVTPYEEEILRNAIERELARGGQVFIVNNRITGLGQIRETVERLVPDAVVAVGHGRMSEDDLERTMLDFVEGRANVLIATTIIENGIDIPNANTMIILNADRFGLAQLYQLRGRVGRSHRLAYAYLMYQPGKVLTDLARKRLTAIREFTEFGAGFKLAMRDLELRGAGNMLGEAQSGHIESIGYELYCKEIDRAVRRLKGEVVTDQRSDITIDIPAEASIPASYIEDETLRLQAYRKIAGITCQEDAEDLEDEFTDRYGDIPEEMLSLIKVAEIRAHAELCGASHIAAIPLKASGARIEVKFAGNTRFSAYAAVMTKAEFGDDLTITSGKNSGLSLYVRNPAGGRSGAGANAGSNAARKPAAGPNAGSHANGAGNPDVNSAVCLDRALALLRTLRYAIETEEQARKG